MDSNSAYNRKFADYYDRITQHKDYSAETNTLISVFCQAGAPANSKILDVGCGTGTHAILLAEKGYDLTAIDLSPDMIRVAKAKSARVKFKCADILKIEDSGFHFCYSLFNVINCLDTIDALILFFRAMFDRLIDRGGLLIESWNPIAVVADPPEVVERRSESENEYIIRTVVPTPDFFYQRLTLQYDVDAYRTQERGKKDGFSVVHHLVLFTPLEIEYALKQAGFKDIKALTALPEMAPATAADRMLAFTAKK